MPQPINQFLHNSPLQMPIRCPTPLERWKSAQSVAERFGISVAELRKLNQFRTFARGFDNVRQGDELDVPAQVSENNLTPPPGNSSGNLEQQIASTSQLIGSLLAEDMNSEQAANIARGWASSQASGVMTDWLSRFGTARITLGVDEDFSLKNSRDGNPRKWRFDATNSELCAERHEC